MKYTTNYKVAVHWLNSSLILCNNIAEIDETVIENARFNFVEEDEDGNETITEIFQWYLTDCNESEVEFLEEHFGLLFSYSEKLDLYILCVDHYGTSWDYVLCDCDFENAARELGESK